MKVEITITPEIKELFDRIGEDINAAMPYGMQNLLSDLEARSVKEAPVSKTDAKKTGGNLAGAISNYMTDGGFGGVVKASDTAPYAKYVHEGTGPHTITGNPALAFLVGGATVFARSVKHPGTKANKFFDRAVSQTDVKKSFEEGLNNFLRQKGY